MEFDINQPMNFYKDAKNNIFQIITREKTYNISHQEWKHVLTNLEHWRGLDEPDTLHCD